MIDEKIEANVIGRLIIHPEEFKEVYEIVTEKDFRISLYKNAFISIRESITASPDIEIDIYSLYVDMGSPDGAAEKLGECIDDATLPGSHYANILKKRNLQDSIQSNIKDREYDLAQKRIQEYQDLGKPTTLYTIPDMISATATRNKVQGFSTGFVDLDKFLRLRPTNLCVIAGKPSAGKTSFGLSILANMSMQVPTGLVSFEMSIEEIGERLSIMYSMNYLNEIRPNLLASAPSSFTVSEVRKSVKAFIKQNNARVVMVDYLQMMGDPRRSESRRIEISNIIKSLKSLAREFGVVMIVISSLARNSDRGENAKPIMSDLKESGDIEYAADSILFIWRPDDKPIELLLDKNRGGVAKKTVNIVWLEDKVKFGNWDWRNENSVSH